MRHIHCQHKNRPTITLFIFMTTYHDNNGFWYLLVRHNEHNRILLSSVSISSNQDVQAKTKLLESIQSTEFLKQLISKIQSMGLDFDSLLPPHRYILSNDSSSVLLYQAILPLLFPFVLDWGQHSAIKRDERDDLHYIRTQLQHLIYWIIAMTKPS